MVAWVADYKLLMSRFAPDAGHRLAGNSCRPIRRCREVASDGTDFALLWGRPGETRCLRVGADAGTLDFQPRILSTHPQLGSYSGGVELKVVWTGESHLLVWALPGDDSRYDIAQQVLFAGGSLGPREVAVAGAGRSGARPSPAVAAPRFSSILERARAVAKRFHQGAHRRVFKLIEEEVFKRGC